MRTNNLMVSSFAMDYCKVIIITIVLSLRGKIESRYPRGPDDQILIFVAFKFWQIMLSYTTVFKKV